MSIVPNNLNPPSPMLYISFNQDSSCLSAGTRRGFRIFNSLPFRLLYAHDFRSGCQIASMLYRSSILALGSKDDNSIVLYDDQSGRELGEIHFDGLKYLNCFLTRDKVFVVFSESVKVYNLNDLQPVDELKTGVNPGFIAIAGEKSPLVAVPGLETGSLILKNYYDSTVRVLSNMHENNIYYATFSQDQKYLATASEKGTLIRIWDVKTGEKTREIRRGSQPAKIMCLAFSQDCSKLAVTSSHGTVHVFKALTDDSNKKSKLSFLGNYFDSEWSVWKYDVKCPFSICRFLGEDLIVCCGNGKYYKLSFKDEELILSAQGELLGRE